MYFVLGPASVAAGRPACRAGRADLPVAARVSSVVTQPPVREFGPAVTSIAPTVISERVRTFAGHLLPCCTASMPLRIRLRKPRTARRKMGPTVCVRSREPLQAVSTCATRSCRFDVIDKLFTGLMLAGPAGLDPATSWFVAVNLFVDPAQRTARETSEMPVAWDPI